MNPNQPITILARRLAHHEGLPLPSYMTDAAGGLRVAQLVAAPVLKAELEVVENLPGTERGSGGFGHTGTH